MAAKKANGTGITVEVDLRGMKRRFSSQQLRAAQAALTEKVGNDSNEYCPVDKGDLRGSMRFTEKEVVWPQRYASYVYYMAANRIKAKKNPKAASKWFEVAKARHKPEWARLVKERLS